MSSLTIGIIGIVIFLILIFKGMNIGLALLLVGFVGYAAVLNPTAAFVQLRTDPSTNASTYSFIVVPLFILMGNFAYHAGLSGGLYACANKWLNRLPGSLACATVAACAGFGAICGSCAATAATMGTISLPEMRKYGYDDKLSTGSVAMGGTLGILIPPSTPMIIFAIMAECSIGKLFIAGILPGIMMAVLCIITIMILILRNPSLAPKGTKYSWRERFASFKGLVGVVVLFGVVLGGMFTGIFSVNQSAAIGAFLAFILMVINLAIHNELKWAKFWTCFKSAMWDSITTFAMTFLIIIGASLFCKFLTISQLPMSLANYIGTLSISKYAIIALMMVVYIFLGMIMDELPMIMLTVPIFLPIIDKLGIDVIWFGVFIILTMEMGAITPPVGLNCFIISGVAKDIPLSTIYKGVIPFTFAIIVGVILLCLFPQIALFLPGLM
ncbi:MAG: TRAP transporter large permease [Oscillospiraceae bacterium]|nr:TRAP transporter large permease [Oscillospiraceae bacterium]